ncbi:unnamed protein product [Musa acuminata var. zebrina]
MAKTKPGKKDLDSYTIKSTNKVVKVGDCVLMRPAESGKPPYVARVEKIEADHRNNVRVRVRWYYRPEESIGGRRQFHGAKELFLSDHYDVQSAHTIEGKCIVHSFKNYTKLENVGAEDYFCRFEYKAATGAFTPDRIAVYCKCEMPYNPDDLMVQCEGCKDWQVTSANLSNSALFCFSSTVPCLLGIFLLTLFYLLMKFYRYASCCLPVLFCSFKQGENYRNIKILSFVFS